MRDISPEAYGDAVLLAISAPSSILPISVVELHLFSYVGCVIALFRGMPIADWGYRFSLTSEGFPFSAELEDARKVMVANGLLEVDDEGLLHSANAELTSELDFISQFGSWEVRREVLATAMECALALPLGSIRHAIGQTPSIAPALRLGQTKSLLEGDDISLLYDEYQIVTKVLGPDPQDLLSPAVLWLSARVLRAEELPVGD